MLPDANVVADAISDHMSSLSTLGTTMISLVLVALVAMYSDASELEVGPLKLRRHDWFIVLLVAFFTLDLLMTIAMLRVLDLVHLLPSDAKENGLARIFMSAWVLSPFSSFGSGATSVIHASASYGMFFVAVIAQSSVVSGLGSRQKRMWSNRVLSLVSMSPVILLVTPMFFVRRQLAAMASQLAPSTASPFDPSWSVLAVVIALALAAPVFFALRRRLLELDRTAS